MSVIDLGAPMRGSKDGYLQHFFISRQIFMQKLATATSIRDPFISLNTGYLISSVTDADAREDLYKKKREYYEQKLQELNSDDPSEEEKAQALAEACMMVLGDVTSWFDEFLAITHSQTYGVCGVLPGEDEDEKRFGGGERGNGNDNAESECDNADEPGE